MTTPSTPGRFGTRTPDGSGGQRYWGRLHLDRATRSPRSGCARGLPGEHSASEGCDVGGVRYPRQPTTVVPTGRANRAPDQESRTPNPNR